MWRFKSVVNPFEQLARRETFAESSNVWYTAYFRFLIKPGSVRCCYISEVLHPLASKPGIPYFFVRGPCTYQYIATRLNWGSNDRSSDDEPFFHIFRSFERSRLPGKFPCLVHNDIHLGVDELLVVNLSKAKSKNHPQGPE